MYTFFDTETNGKIAGNYDAPLSIKNISNFPRITQICFQSYTENGELISEFHSLIKPDGWEVPKEKFFIDNNMSTERCEKEGIPIKDALILSIVLIRFSTEYLIAHNMSFDQRVLGAEMIRAKKNLGYVVKKFCTMEAATQICKIPRSKYGTDFKFPKLEELYFFLFNEKMDEAHDATWDVTATAKCFFEMKKRGLINI
jgi:DNA polymerase-3 subunit epsilon